MRETLVVVALTWFRVCPVNAQPNIWELLTDMEVRRVSSRKGTGFYGKRLGKRYEIIRRTAGACAILSSSCSRRPSLTYVRRVIEQLYIMLTCWNVTEWPLTSAVRLCRAIVTCFNHAFFTK